MPSSSIVAPTNKNRRRNRRNYTSIANEDMDGDHNDSSNAASEDGDDRFHDEPLKKSLDKNDDDDCDLTVTILDSAQKKFPIPCKADWTVGTLKLKSAKIHKVPPSQQRLIFRGRMLTNDEQTLRENKIDANDLIIHLFPKPRVFITATKKEDKSKQNLDDDTNADSDNDSGIVDDNENDDHGAHIPSIVIDQEEQDRRGQILVLGSVEIAESQNNVKMLSLLLVMICATRLLALFAIAMGEGVESPDAYAPQHGGGNYTEGGEGNFNHPIDTDFLDDTVDPMEDYEPRLWQTQDYFDLLVSAIGFYVGSLGMKATQENTFQLATAYAIGTIIAGIGWNFWNVYEYIKFYKEQQEYRAEYSGHDGRDHGNSTNSYADNDDELPPLTRDDMITVAFFTILLPLFVWFLCCVRAFEFRRLLGEAEEEAAERIRNEYVVREGDETDRDGTEIV